MVVRVPETSPHHLRLTLPKHLSQWHVLPLLAHPVPLHPCPHRLHVLCPQRIVHQTHVVLAPDLAVHEHANVQGVRFQILTLSLDQLRHRLHDCLKRFWTQLCYGFCGFLD